MKIAIFGFGFVGQAVARSYKHKEDVLVFDPCPDARKRASALGFKTYHEDTLLMGPCDAAFVCVPTPSRPDGSCDDQYLRAAVASAHCITSTVICKSTAPISVYKQFDLHTVAYVPEFLRQASADRDYMEQTRIIVGAGTRELACRVIDSFSETYLSFINFVHVPREAAIIGKYAHNCSLAAKVAVMNEMYGLAYAEGVDWRNVEAVLHETNAGGSHIKVPGPDGKQGFGGACFPKDLRATLHELETVENTTASRLPRPVLESTLEWAR